MISASMKKPQPVKQGLPVKKTLPRAASSTAISGLGLVRSGSKMLRDIREAT